MIYPRSLLLLLLCLAANGWASAQKQSPSSVGRLESEYKLAVPPEIKDDLWKHLQDKFTNQKVQTLDSLLSTSRSEEIFIDTYFDNDEKVLLQNNAGLRYRKRYIADTLAKELLQVKLPSKDTFGITRIEVKFPLYKNKKKNDRKAMHPFWKYIKPKYRQEINELLAPYRTTGDDLSPAIKVKQIRQRIYFQESGEALLTITLDEVRSFYFPYPSFTELELEINEIRYTLGDETERKRLETLNNKIKTELLQKFPQLQQDQSPKYNKMYALVSKSILAQMYMRLQYIIFAVIVAIATLLYFSRKR